MKSMEKIILFIVLFGMSFFVLGGDGVFENKVDLQDLQKWVLGGGVVVLCIFFWNKFIRLRCPKCNSTNHDLIDAQEIDRWRGRKQVTERLGNGKTRTRNVSTTFVKIKRFYVCNDCGNNWSEISKEEK